MSVNSIKDQINALIYITSDIASDAIWMDSTSWQFCSKGIFTAFHTWNTQIETTYRKRDYCFCYKPKWWKMEAISRLDLSI